MFVTYSLPDAVLQSCERWPSRRRGTGMNGYDIASEQRTIIRKMYFRNAKTHY